MDNFVQDDRPNAFRIRCRHLNVDKMRCHILECLTIYITLFGPFEDRGESEEAQSKIFLSALRDIAVTAQEERLDLGYAREGLSLLLRDWLVNIPKKMQVQSESDQWFPLKWAGVVDGITDTDVRAVLGCSTSTSSDQKASVLHYAVAAKKPNFSVIKATSSPASFQRTDKDNRIPLHWAGMYSNDINMIRYLLEQSSKDVCTRKRDGSGKIPLQYLVERPSFPSKLSMVTLLAEGDVDSLVASSETASTPLHSICRYGMCEANMTVFNELIRINPSAIKARDKLGSLPLHYACRGSNVNVIKVLLNAYSEGAFVTNQAGELPMHFIFKWHKVDVEKWAAILTANPAGATQRTSSLSSHLHYAVGSNYCELSTVKYLHELDPTAAHSKDIDGYLPLHLACKHRNSLQIVQAVYDCYPAAINECSNRGFTPIYCLLRWQSVTCWIAESDEENILRFLLRHSPRVDVRKYIFKPEVPQGNEGDEDDEDVSEEMPDFVRRLLLRANPSASPAEFRELNYAERRTALFLIFSAISKDPPEASFVHRLRALAMDHGPEMYLVKSIVSFL